MLGLWQRSGSEGDRIGADFTIHQPLSLEIPEDVADIECTSRGCSVIDSMTPKLQCEHASSTASVTVRDTTSVSTWRVRWSLWLPAYLVHLVLR